VAAIVTVDDRTLTQSKWTQAHQTSADAADAAARVALAAASASMGAAQQAQEDARAARLRHAMRDDLSMGGALSPRAPHHSGGFLQDGPRSGPESSENSFSR
jgi:prophage DNA circulation protein